MHVTFYVQENCALCEEAEMMMKLVAEDDEFIWEKVDIKSDDALHEKYMLMVPVIEYETRVLLYGNIGYVDLVLAIEEAKE